MLDNVSFGKVYIVGKITGESDYLNRFFEAERFLNEHGYRGRVTNLATISQRLPVSSMNYQDYIHIGLSMLRTCNTVYVLKGWEESLGASLELQYALTLGYKILYEE